MEDPSQLYHQAFEPFKVETGTEYPTTQVELDFHRRNTFKERNPSPYVGDNRITASMTWQNDMKRSISTIEYDAIHRLRQLLQYYDSGYPYGPDIAVKAFADLDLVFFNGYLRGNVCVTWSRCGKDKGFACDGVNHCSFGYTQSTFRPYRGQCRIVLNADSIFGDEIQCPFETMMTTLLHEMCHAIDFVRCGRSHSRDGDGEGHDEHFGTRINVVHKRATRTLGLKAIDDWEPYLQHHWFGPTAGHSERWSCGGREHHGDGEHHAEAGRQEAVTPAPIRSIVDDVRAEQGRRNRRERVPRDGHQRTQKGLQKRGQSDLRGQNSRRGQKDQREEKNEHPPQGQCWTQPQ